MNATRTTYRGELISLGRAAADKLTEVDEPELANAVRELIDEVVNPLSSPLHG